MPKPAKGARLGSGPAHEKLLLGGLAAALIREERIRTTQAKAKRLKPVADRLVTLGKSGTIHARRQALRMITDRDIVHKLFDDVAPRFADRNGGYTRVLKLGPRKGDAAPMAIIEFVEGQVVEKATTEEDQKKRRLPLRRKSSSKTKPKTEETLSEEGTAASVEPESGRSTRPDAQDQAAGTARLEGDADADGPSASEVDGEPSSEDPTSSPESAASESLAEETQVEAEETQPEAEAVADVTEPEEVASGPVATDEQEK